MRKISRFGAAALALALSVTFLTPVSVNAMTDTNVNADGTYTKTSKETGKSATFNASDEQQTGTSDFDETYYQANKIEVGLNQYTEFTIIYPYGQVSAGKIKIKSGKSNISVSQAGYSKSVNDYKNTQHNYDEKKTYFVDPATGAIEEIKDDGSNELASYGSTTLRIFGKQIGKSKIEIQVNDENGKKVATKKLNISVVEDTSPFKSVTFAGKNLITASNGKATDKYLYDKYTFTDKKAGKFKVKMRKGCTVRAIYVVKNLGTERYTASDDEYSTDVNSKAVTTKVDLNGDGDYKDTIDGIKESEHSKFSIEKISNGKKVTLNKVPSYSNFYGYLSSDTNDEYYDSTTYKKETDSKGNKINRFNESSYKGNMSVTTFYVVYSDNRYKEWSHSTFTVKRRISKK